MGGQTDEWCERIRRQLTQILASPAFRNSRRNSDLLKYLVERTVEGKTEALKERNIGVDVFARTAEYDTATDHVVRSAASEIRKRLAQYYLEFGQEADITLDLYPGSYIPQFGLRREGPRDATDSERQETPIPKTADARPGSRPLGTWLVLFSVFCAGAVLALGVTLLASHRAQTPVDRFWAPLISHPGPVLLCIGNARHAGALADAQQVAGGGPPAGSPGLTVQPIAAAPVTAEDAMTLARIAGTLQAAGKGFRILAEQSTSLDDLRQGTAVLIGALNNDWVLRLTGVLRFRFEDAKAGDRIFIRDSKSPSQAAWHPIPSTRSGEYTTDYAIVARCWNPETSQMVVVAAGAHRWGTRAAGEFLTNSESLKKLEALAQENRDRKNLQVVLSTEVVRGIPGPPNVVAAHFW